MHDIMAPQHRLHREQSQNPQRYGPNPQIADREPRQDSQHRVGDQSCRKAIHTVAWPTAARDFASGAAPLLRASIKLGPRLIPREANFWCTGEDSNLRTSLGGTDLQSVGFNHSPTCAIAFRRCGPSLVPADRAICSADIQKKPAEQTQPVTGQFRKTGKPRSRTKTIAKITARRKSSEWSALEKPVAPLQTESAA